MKKQPQATFEISTAQRTGRLADVTVHRDGFAPVKFGQWFGWLMIESPFRHRSADRYPVTKGTETDFRVTRNIWVTFCKLRLSLYSRSKLQVRATFSFRNTPFTPHASHINQCEVSWLLSETSIILPALFQSILQMDWKPLRETGLFEDGKPSGSPERGCYVWTIKGNNA